MASHRLTYRLVQHSVRCYDKHCVYRNNVSAMLRFQVWGNGQDDLHKVQKALEVIVVYGLPVAKRKIHSLHSGSPQFVQALQDIIDVNHDTSKGPLPGITRTLRVHGGLCWHTSQVIRYGRTGCSCLHTHENNGCPRKNKLKHPNETAMHCTQHYLCESWQVLDGHCQWSPDFSEYIVDYADILHKS